MPFFCHFAALKDKKELHFVNVAVHPTESYVTLYKVDDPKDFSHTGWASLNPDRFANTIYKENFTKQKKFSNARKKLILVAL